MVCDNLGRIWYENVVLHPIYWIILSFYIFLDFETVNSFKKNCSEYSPVLLWYSVLWVNQKLFCLSLSLSLSPLSSPFYFNISALLEFFSMKTLSCKIMKKIIWVSSLFYDCICSFLLLFCYFFLLKYFEFINSRFELKLKNLKIEMVVMVTIDIGGKAD